MARIRIRNWRKFQHYKDRRPDWIKLHAQLLDNLDFRRLSDSGKGALVSLWLLAARLHDSTDTDAELPGDPQYLADLTGCRITDEVLRVLVGAGFIESDAEIEPTQPKSSPRKAANQFEFPPELDTQEFRAAWDEWFAYRRESKLGKWSARTVKTKLAELAAVGSEAAVRCIRKSIGNGYGGLFTEREAKTTKRPGGTIPAQTNDARQARLERIGQEDAA